MPFEGPDYLPNVLLTSMNFRVSLGCRYCELQDATRRHPRRKLIGPRTLAES